jgi:hypothetical protein
VGPQLPAVLMRVRAGDLWEFDNPDGYPIERYCLVLILGVEEQGEDPNNDRFTHVTLDSFEREDVGELQETHLTMRTSEYGHLWKKVE